MTGNAKTTMIYPNIERLRFARRRSKKKTTNVGISEFTKKMTNYAMN